MKILSAFWFTTGASIAGVVCIENSIGERSVRIGARVIGGSEKEDTQYVAENGRKLDYEVSKAFFPEFIDAENFKGEVPKKVQKTADPEIIEWHLHDAAQSHGYDNISNVLKSASENMEQARSVVRMAVRGAIENVKKEELA